MQSAPNSFPPLLLMQVTRLWQRKAKEALQPVGITNAQFGGLMSVWRLEKSQEFVTQVMLSEVTQSDIMTVSQLLTSLEKKGLIQRLPHPTDSRAKRLLITEAGRKKIIESLPIIKQAAETFFKSIKKDEEQLIGVLRELIEANGG